MPQQTTSLYANAYNALSLPENYAIVVRMASSADIRGKSGAPCLHSRLILETTTTAARYLTGYYVCEECGQHFDRPPIKQDPPIEQDSPPTPAT